MLLDATSVLQGVGLAVAGFAVVVVVTAVVLRLIGVVLGDGDPVAPDESDTEATSESAVAASDEAGDEASAHDEPDSPGEADPA